MCYWTKDMQNASHFAKKFLHILYENEAASGPGQTEEKAQNTDSVCNAVLTVCISKYGGGTVIMLL